MSRPSFLSIDGSALIHNLNYIKAHAPGKKIIAMVKANAYGCGLRNVIPLLEGEVDAFGVACLEEALTIRSLGSKTSCLIFQGFFHPDELPILVRNQCSTVIHCFEQLHWLLKTPLELAIKVWIKVDTGMHRLGFQPHEVADIVIQLRACHWVDNELGIMTHLSAADNLDSPETALQLMAFNSIDLSFFHQKSIANSAAILNFPKTHVDVIRPGLLLYGVSPLPNIIGRDLGLQAVMHFKAKIMAIHHYTSPVAIGYSGHWKSEGSATIGIISVGYGDGYPRHISSAAYVWINGCQAPIVGRVSMDMMAIDLTKLPQTQVGDWVELWGKNLAIEHVAAWSGTFGYELLCQVTPRAQGIFG